MSRRSPGEGSVTQRKDGRWQGSLQVDGKRRTCYGRTRSEAATKLAALRHQANAAGALPEPGKRTVGDLLSAWLELKAPAWRPKTAANYKATMDAYLRPSLGHLRLDRLTPEHVARLLATLQAKGHHRTAQVVYRVLSQALSLAVRWRWLTADVCERVDTPRYRPPRRQVWTTEQTRRFLDGAANHRLYPLWLFLVASGCRLGEATALEWRDTDLAVGVVTVAKSVQRVNGQWIVTAPKTRAGERVVSLPAAAVRALHQQRGAQLLSGMDTALVFAATDGGYLHHATVEHAMKRECQRLGLPPQSPHSLRHQHASLLLAEGVPLPEVSARLGHATSAITLAVYAHALSQDDAAAAAAIARALTQP